MKIWNNELKELEEYISTVKGKVEDLEKELVELSKASNDVTALLYARRSLETIVSELCTRNLKRKRGTEPLRGIIDLLSRELHIPSFIHTAMINLNTISNYGAHPKDFDSRQVRTALIDLSTIIAWYLEERNLKADFQVTNNKILENNVSKSNRAKEITGVNWKRTAVFLIIFIIAGITTWKFYRMNVSETYAGEGSEKFSSFSGRDKAYIVAIAIALSEIGEKKEGYNSREKLEIENDLIVTDDVKTISTSQIGTLNITTINDVKGYITENHFVEINYFDNYEWNPVIIKVANYQLQSIEGNFSIPGLDQILLSSRIIKEDITFYEDNSLTVSMSFLAPTYFSKIPVKLTATAISGW